MCLTSTRQEPHSPSWQSNGIGMWCALASASRLPRSPATAYTVTSRGITSEENVTLAMSPLLLDHETCSDQKSKRCAGRLRAASGVFHECLATQHSLPPRSRVPFVATTTDRYH